MKMCNLLLAQDELRPIKTTAFVVFFVGLLASELDRKILCPREGNWQGMLLEVQGATYLNFRHLALLRYVPCPLMTFWAQYKGIWRGQRLSAKYPKLTYVRPRPHSPAFYSQCYITHLTCDIKEPHAENSPCSNLLCFLSIFLTVAKGDNCQISAF